MGSEMCIRDRDLLVQTLDIEHKTPSEFKTASVKNKFTERDIKENEVYVVNYDMQQAETVSYTHLTLPTSDLV